MRVPTDAAGGPGPGAAAAADWTAVQAGQSWAYLLWGPRCAVLVDAGDDPAASALRAALAARGHGPEFVRAILLTHGHRQVRAGLAAFADAEVYAGEPDWPLLRGLRHPRAPLARLQHRLRPAPPVQARLLPLLAGQRLQLCGAAPLEVVALPGHTPGSRAIVQGRLALVGDSLQYTRAGLHAAPATLSDAAGDIPRALRRLRRHRPLALASSTGGWGMLDETAPRALWPEGPPR